eukprot:936398-Amorphochlora_amoeboformis.AAC.1
MNSDACQREHVSLWTNVEFALVHIELTLVDVDTCRVDTDRVDMSRWSHQFSGTCPQTACSDLHDVL